MAGQDFPKSRHLRKTDEISSVFNFRCRQGGEYLEVLARPNGLGFSRLAVMAAKKNIRRAVARNYARRAVREIFRGQQQTGGLDVVVRVRKEPARAAFPQVRQELLQHLSRLQQRLAPSNGALGTD